MTQNSINPILSTRKASSAAVYVRAASSVNPKQHNSIGSQLDMCLKRAAEIGYVEILVFQDIDHSGADPNRPDYQRLLKAIQDREIDGLVIYSLERLTRSIGDGVKILTLLDNQEVALHSVTEPIDTSSAQGRLNAVMAIAYYGFHSKISGLPVEGLDDE